MQTRIFEQLEAALNAVRQNMAPRVDALARKSTTGQLTPEEHMEYVGVVRFNEVLSLLKLEAEELRILRPSS